MHRSISITAVAAVLLIIGPVRGAAQTPSHTAPRRPAAGGSDNEMAGSRAPIVTPTQTTFSAMTTTAGIVPALVPSAPMRPTGPIAVPSAPRFRGTLSPADRGKSGARLLATGPAPAATFPGVTDSSARQIIPPDVGGAVGPNHLMVVHNSYVRIQTRTGGTVSTVTLNGFWSSLGSPSSFDPKAVYDPYGGRWIFVSCGNAASASSSVLLGVSQSSDPTGGWNLYRIDADPADVNWADFPYVGFNGNWVVVTMNMFTVAGGNYSYWKAWTLKKSDLYAGLATTPTIFTGTDGFSLAPVATYDPSVSSLYLVDAEWQAGGGSYTLRRISGAVGAETMTTISNTSILPVYDMWPPTTNWGPQAGTASRIALNDGRIGNAVYRNGSVWLAHPVFAPSGSATRGSVIQWLQLSTSGLLQQAGRIGDGIGPTLYGFPSIAVNANNDVTIGYSSFSPSQYASANYSFRFASDPAGTMRDDYVFKAGEAPYVKDFGSGRNRWGDYSTTQVDPVNDRDFWTIQEYAMAPGGGLTYRWASHWAYIVVCPPITVNISADPTVISGTDHGMRTVATTLDISGGCTPTVQLLSVVSSEADAGLGGGDVAGDVANASIGAADFNVDLRAETAPAAVARVYTMRYRISDGVTTRDVAVDVPVINNRTNVDRPYSWAYVGQRPSSPPAALSPAIPTTLTTSSTITFTTGAPQVCRLGIFTLGGTLIRGLIVNERVSGTRSVAWDGTDSRGVAVPNGTYLVQLDAGGAYSVGVIRVER